MIQNLKDMLCARSSAMGKLQSKYYNLWCSIECYLHLFTYVPHCGNMNIVHVHYAL